MTARRIAQLIIIAYDYKSAEEFTRIIEFLSICMYHLDNEEITNQIQKAIWYLQDKQRKFTNC